MSWPTHRSLDDTQAFLERCDAEWASHPAGVYFISLREDKTLLGSTGLSFLSSAEDHGLHLRSRRMGAWLRHRGPCRHGGTGRDARGDAPRGALPPGTPRLAARAGEVWLSTRSSRAERDGVPESGCRRNPRFTEVRSKLLSDRCRLSCDHDARRRAATRVRNAREVEPWRERREVSERDRMRAGALHDLRTHDAPRHIE